MKTNRFLGIALLALLASGALAQAPPPTTISGTILTQNLVPTGVATADSAVEIETVGKGSVSVQATSTWTGTLSAYCTVDRTVWALNAWTPITANGISVINALGCQKVRVAASAAVTGGAVVTLHAEPSTPAGTSGGGGTADSTAANQATQITAEQAIQTSVASINTKTPAQGQALAASSWPVVLTAAQLSTLTPPTTVTSNLGTLNGAATAAKQPALGTAGTAATDVISVQGVASMTPIKTDGSATTQPVTQAGGTAVAPKVGDATGAITDTFDALGCLRRDALSSLSSATARYLQIQCDKWGAVFVKGYEKHSRTYSSTVNVASASSATDIAYIAGSATSPVLVTRVIISGVQTTAGSVDFTLLTRSTANSAGTCTAATMVAHDPGDSAANAVVTSCTANPTTGTLVGTVRRAYQLVPTAAGTSSVPPLVFDFGKEGKPITLTTSNKVLALNLGGVTVTGGTFSVTFEWIENP